MNASPGDTFAAAARPALLERLGRDEYDVVVIGGGITGAGVALDAATRGLKVALVEKDDLASGTSSKSSKLVHGGLRYLQSGDVRLVYEALAERQRLLSNAEHLVRPLDFVIPVWHKKAYAKALNSGLWLYDLTGGFRIGKMHRPLSPDEAVQEMPTLSKEHMVGGFFFPDAQTDDARLTMYLARTAAVHYGADIATHLPAVGTEKDAAGRIVGVTCRDALDSAGALVTVRAKVVVNAGGVWADEVSRLDDLSSGGTLRPAKGIHVVVPRSLVRNNRAFIVPVPKDKRSIFVLPWGPVAWVGTTDTDYDGPLDDPKATPEDIAYLLEALNTWLVDPISTSDVISSWAGLRPLVASAQSERTADLSRRHKITFGSPGMLSVTGGKLTTYRRMAQDAVDATLEVGGFGRRRCRTKRLWLDGRAGFDAQQRFGLDATAGEGADETLLRRHGGNVDIVLEPAIEDLSLREPLAEGLPYIRAEVLQAVRQEAALTVADVLERRIRLSLEDRSRGLDSLDDVIGLMGDELGWEPERRKTEREGYVDRVRATVTAEAVTTRPKELADR